jgi:hypothetical protein
MEGGRPNLYLVEEVLGFYRCRIQGRCTELLKEGGGIKDGGGISQDVSAGEAAAMCAW